ncbi:MAG: hypothetical protein JO137_17110, partial [Hyphomicrobiales bacterium]|nr:hypothetical protein [Hyphomicrobiales bacterium]
MLMRNEESQETFLPEESSFVGKEEVGAAHASRKGAVGGAPASQAATSRATRGTLGIMSYVLSAIAVLAALGFLLAVGLNGRFSSVVQDPASRDAPAPA